MVVRQVNDVGGGGMTGWRDGGTRLGFVGKSQDHECERQAKRLTAKLVGIATEKRLIDGVSKEAAQVGSCLRRMTTSLTIRAQVQEPSYLSARAWTGR